MKNREIKFRVWTGLKMEHNVIVGKFGAFFINPGAKGDGLDATDTASLTPFNTLYPSDTPIMQSTGLKDRNGVEIYEGDIVKFERETTELVNHPKVFATTKEKAIYQGAIMWGEYGWKPFTYSGVDKNSFEVIGNIYENPELLK